MHINTNLAFYFKIEVPHEILFRAVVSKMWGGEVYAPQGGCKMIQWSMEFSLFIYFLPCKVFIPHRFYIAHSILVP